jgi:MFS family permease
MAGTSATLEKAPVPRHEGERLSIFELNRRFWTFFCVAVFCNLGLMIFFLLYNLYLLDFGFNERFLGLVVGAFSLGSMLGALPAGALAQRLGLRKTILFCLVLVALSSALRAEVASRFALLAISVVAGVALSIWAVCLSPAVAQLTDERCRSVGFSVMFSTGIGIGVIGGIVAGHLPAWLSTHFGISGAMQSKRVSLLVSALVVAVGIIPALFLRFAPHSASNKKVFPRSPFLLRFLLVMGTWTLVTGSFSPFFNAYATQYLHLPLESVGSIFSVSQLTQVVAILLSPIVFRQFGFVPGIMYMQLAASLSFAWLALDHHGALVPLSYSCLVAFQWMSEPGLYSLLMERVQPHEQSGASAMNTLTNSASQAFAGMLAGAGYARFGYPPVLWTLAALAAAMALLLRFLLDPVRSHPGN